MAPECLSWTTRCMVASFTETGNNEEGEILEREVIYLIFELLTMKCVRGVHVDML